MEFMTDEMKMMEAEETTSHPRSESEWQELVNELNEELDAEREENEIHRLTLNHYRAQTAELNDRVEWLEIKIKYLSVKLDIAEKLLGKSIDFDVDLDFDK